jgi:hypothetical protein
MNQPVQTTLHAGKFLTLIKEGHWEYVDRVNASGASVIVAVTEEQKLLLVEQYRIPVHTRTIELLATRTHKAPLATGVVRDTPDMPDRSRTAGQSPVGPVDNLRSRPKTLQAGGIVVN